MKRYLCKVQYIGTNYCGFQIQDNGITIQQKIEEALFKAFGQKIEVFASGRTDAGVHALAQTLHFDADITIPANKIPFAVNQFLPDDISFLEAKEVSNNFNARFDVKKKIYQYDMYVSSVQLPVKEHAYWLKTMPNVELMKQASRVLCGTHNFKAFASAGAQTKTFERHIYDIKIEKKQNDINIEVSGNGFLYNMVRIIVGTLLEVGYGKKTVDDVKKILESQKREKAGYLVPAHALFLKSVKYWFCDFDLY